MSVSALILISARNITEKVPTNWTRLCREGRRETASKVSQLCNVTGTASTRSNHYRVVDKYLIMDFLCQYFCFTSFPLFWCYSPSKRKIIAAFQMVINSSGIMAVCCLIMHQDIISLSGTIMLYFIPSFHHIKKPGVLPTRALVSWTPPTTLYSNVHNPQRQLQRDTVMAKVEDRLQTRRVRSRSTGH